MLLIVQPADDPVGLGQLVANGIARHRPREDCQQQDLRVRKILAHLEHDRADAFSDFRSGTAASVVRADHQHDRLRLKALPFAVAESPEHPLRRIAGDREIGRPHRAEVLVEHRLVGVALHPKVGDRVAVQQQIDVPLLRHLDEPFVPGSLPLDRLSKGRGDILPRRLQRHTSPVPPGERRTIRTRWWLRSFACTASSVWPIRCGPPSS